MCSGSISRSQRCHSCGARQKTDKAIDRRGGENVKFAAPVTCTWIGCPEWWEVEELPDKFARSFLYCLERCGKLTDVSEEEVSAKFLPQWRMI